MNKFIEGVTQIINNIEEDECFFGDYNCANCSTEPITCKRQIKNELYRVIKEYESGKNG